MSQFEYTNLNKFFVSIGIFLIGLTFLLPWLFFRENFDLLIKADDLKTYTATAQEIINQRQLIVSYYPKIILGISALCFCTGVYLCVKGIKGWNRDEESKQQASALSNMMITQEAQSYSPPEKYLQKRKKHCLMQKGY